MERIVGNRWYVLFLFFFGSLHAEISMRLTDENGAQLESVGVGRPFLLLVEVKNSSSVGQKDLVIEHLDRYDHFRSGVQMTNINGNVSATYTYRCRIDSPGVHSFGPARVPGTQEISSVLPILVNEQPVYKKQPKKEDASVFFRITPSPSSVVVGQKLTLCARFYSSDCRMKLQNITLPHFSGFRVVDKYSPAYGKEKLNGIMYDYTEWCLDLFATEVGNKLIPAFSADYESPNTNRRANFYWGSYANSKRVYSNSLQVSVDSLPTPSRAPDFVGSNATAHASINPLHAKIGEGILYTITFTGEGDMDSLRAPVLKGIPDQIKYYDSKVTAIGGTSNSLPKKQFEYVLQSMQEGSWEIPAQHFEVFDVEQHAYKTVSTLPVMVTITGGGMPKSTPNSLQAMQMSEEPSTDTPDEEGPIRPLHSNGPWYPTPERSPMNWTFFFMLVFAPCVYSAFAYAHRKYLKYAYPNQRMKNIFARARLALEGVKKERKFENLYHIFIVFFADAYAVAPSQVSSEFIKHKLKDAGASDAILAQWDSFFARITEGAFGTVVYERDSKIGVEALEWLNVLKGIIK